MTGERRHDLDALRAFAMLLGLVLHGALAYIDGPWVVRSGEAVPALGLLVASVHGFRMPLFFFLSGYFTAMLAENRGLGGLLRHRTNRIAWPLFLSCLTIVPVSWIVLVWAAGVGAGASPASDGQDVWSAAGAGNAAAVSWWVDQDGVDVDGQDPTFGVTPLTYAVLADSSGVVRVLLDAGADPSAPNRDGGTPLHSAAFLGRAEIAGMLLEAGADTAALNGRGETPRQALSPDRATTEFIAGLLRIPIEWDAVASGRAEVRGLLGKVRPVEGERAGQADLSWLFTLPFFHHLWFLWFLCMLVLGFAASVVLLRRVRWLRLPRVLVTTPLALVWLVPLTLVFQAPMQAWGTSPGFGPDTSAAILPPAHIVLYYGVFFGGGALVWWGRGIDGVSRVWWLQLILACVLLPVGLTVGFGTGAWEELEGVRRVVSAITQVLYAYLMTFGLIGLCRALLSRERRWVRYVSDSSYWLYLAHLPLIMAGQALLVGLALPSMVEFTGLLVLSAALLLVSYAVAVRYTWIGRMLNGRRERPVRVVAE